MNENNSIETEDIFSDENIEKLKKMEEDMEVDYTIDTGLTKLESMKSLIKTFQPLDEQKTIQAIQDISDFISDFPNDHYLLLSNEERYFSMFRTNDLPHDNVASRIVHFLQTDDFITGYGPIKLIDVNYNTSTVEIWLGETYFALFGADFLFINLEDEEETNFIIEGDN